MNKLVNSYKSSSEDEQDQPPSKKPKQQLNPAPAVTLNLSGPLTKLDQKQLTTNITYEDMSAPLQGPVNPYSTIKQANKNMMSGFVEEHHMDNKTFQKMQRTFDLKGYTLNPDVNVGGIVGDRFSSEINGSKLIDELKPKKLERHSKGDLEGEYLGPWAGYKVDDFELTTEPGQESYIPEKLFDKAELDGSAEKIQKETSIMHGAEVRDYLGRGYLHPPQDINVDLRGTVGERENFIPKSLIHTWTGHTKPVQVIRLLPKTAHLLLSGSLDTKIKIWDMYHGREVKRTFMGHSKGIKDLDFNADGTKFLSCSYDRWIKMWDTETGSCITRFNCKKIPYCVKFNPNPDLETEFLMGSQDKKVYQYDSRSGDIVTTYDQHNGAVNTITFLDDEGKRFVTTSDDKTLRQWEWNIPVVVKFVSEPEMYSMPAASLSVDRKWMACQSLDNKIQIYSVGDRIKVNRRKVFSGHIVAGYSCRPSFSPDGRFIASGDSEGKMWFWDWKTCRVLKKYQAHDGPIMSCLWNPHESSKLVTCGNDGNIKYWD